MKWGRWIAVVGLVGLAGCGSGEGGTTTTSQPAAISKGHAEAIWLHQFRRLLVEGESIHKPGIEQRCEAKGSGWLCRGVIPEDETPLPAKDENCLVVEATVTNAGTITEDSAQPLSKIREALHTEAECRL
jgi:hypothetical protein